MELVDTCAPVKYKYLTAKYSKVMTKEKSHYAKSKAAKSILEKIDIIC